MAKMREIFVGLLNETKQLLYLPNIWKHFVSLFKKIIVVTIFNEFYKIMNPVRIYLMDMIIPYSVVGKHYQEAET
jgi:dTDP-4-dehydrorhamnose 3,5-epimerase-like enzyme